MPRKQTDCGTQEKRGIDVLFQFQNGKKKRGVWWVNFKKRIKLITADLLGAGGDKNSFKTWSWRTVQDGGRTARQLPGLTCPAQTSVVHLASVRSVEASALRGQTGRSANGSIWLERSHWSVFRQSLVRSSTAFSAKQFEIARYLRILGARFVNISRTKATNANI